MLEQGRNLYLVGRGYQRRAELLGSYLDSEVVYLPNRWKSRWLRPLDYFLDFVQAFRLLREVRPSHVTVQSPPPYLALAALVCGVPYFLDAHNAAIQGRWARVPFANAIARRAKAVIAHNAEAEMVARSAFPDSKILVLRDPIEVMAGARGTMRRSKDRAMFICSFGADEPIDVIHGLIELRPDVEFVITAPIHRLSEEWQERIGRLPNLTLTGFLPTGSYQELLSTSGAAIVLTTRNATQPSGACEALSSDTPLVLSRTTLTESLFGSWAHIANNDPDALSAALDDALADQRTLDEHRTAWMAKFGEELAMVQAQLGRTRHPEELHEVRP